MSITVSIVVHNSSAEQLKKALDCLLESDEIKHIYIIDNGSSKILDGISSLGGKIIYRKVENRGFGAGHNIAINENKEQEGYHLVMNPDIWWEGDILKKIKDYMDMHSDVGLLMPKVFYPDGALQYTCRMLPTPYDVFIKRFFPTFMINRRMEKYLLMGHDHDKELNCPYLQGSFLFFRNEALKECGGFDERFFMYPEDIDITRRIHSKWKTLYWPGVSIIHEHQAASRKNLKMLKIHAVNMIKYFNKWGWFVDKERRAFNKRLKDSLIFIPAGKRPVGRG